MCDFWKNEEDPSELSSEQWGVVFSRLKAFGVGFVGVNASGEMFTRKDVFDILGHLKALKLAFGINSNGLQLTRSRARRLAELAPRQITIGFDGVGDESYERTRGLAKGFSTVDDNFEHMKRAGLNNIGIGSVLMRENIDDWLPLAQYALEKGLAGIRYTAYHDAYFNPQSDPRFSSYTETSFRERVGQEVERLIDLKRRTGIIRNSEAYLRRVPDFYADQRGYFPVPCLQGSNRIEIDVYGNVTLCSFVTEPLGNLLEQEMTAIWDSETHRVARESAYRGDCPHCFLSCYGEENLRLSTQGFMPTVGNSVRRGLRLLGSRS